MKIAATIIFDLIDLDFAKTRSTSGASMGDNKNTSIYRVPKERHIKNAKRIFSVVEEFLVISKPILTRRSE